MRVEASRELLASRSDVWGFLSQPYHLAGLVADDLDRASRPPRLRAGRALGGRRLDQADVFRKANATGVAIVKVVELHERVVWTLSGERLDLEVRLRALAPDRTLATVARRGPLAARGVRPAASRREGGRRPSLRARPDGRRTRGAEGGVAVFDLRYHVASLTAVFIALIIGILVGVGISSGGFVKKSERRILNDQIEKVQRELDAARTRNGDLARTQRASETFVEASYPLLMDGLLDKKRVAVVFVGAVDAEKRDLVERTLDDAGAGNPLRLRAMRVPVDLTALDKRLAGRPAARPLREGRTRRATSAAASPRSSRRAARRRSGEPLAPELVEERSGNDKLPADAIVIVRSATPQQGDTARLLRGFYEGLASQDVPAVGVETSRTTPTAIDAFDKADLSSVDFVDTRAGRLALALLLAGAAPGSYGLKPTATDGVLPPTEPLVEARASTEG